MYEQALLQIYTETHQKTDRQNKSNTLLLLTEPMHWTKSEVLREFILQDN
jgi:hypothetical protein